jgi:hypothetical protein
MQNGLSSNFESIEKQLNIKIPDTDKEYLNTFLKKKSFHIVNKKITYPKIEDIKYIIQKLEAEIKELKSTSDFWKKEKNTAEKYHKLLPINMVFNKNYWRHNVKKLINKKYKQDIIDAKLSDRILLDPEYKNLFETFLVDPDYRRKLRDTVNNSIIYKNNKIGDYSIRKQEFKKTSAEFKVKQVEDQIKDVEHKLKVYEKVYEYLKKYN